MQVRYEKGIEDKTVDFLTVTRNVETNNKPPQRFATTLSVLKIDSNFI